MEPAPKNGTMKINNVQFTVMQGWWQTFRTDAHRVLRFLNSTSTQTTVCTDTPSKCAKFPATPGTSSVQLVKKASRQLVRETPKLARQ